MRHQWRLTGAAARAALALIRRGEQGDEDNEAARRESSRWQGGPAALRAKNDSPGAPERPQRAGFGLGPPAAISARAGENWALGGATGPFF